MTIVSVLQKAKTERHSNEYPTGFKTKKGVLEQLLVPRGIVGSNPSDHSGGILLGGEILTEDLTILDSRESGLNNPVHRFIFAFQKHGYVVLGQAPEISLDPVPFSFD